MKDQLDKIQKLRSNIKEYNRLYYIENNPIISDEQYDFFVKELEKLENDYIKEFGELSERDFKDIGYEISSSSKEKQSQPMLSLANCYNIDELHDFDKKIKKNLNIESLDYVVEEKLDGLSISIEFKKGIMYKALTRGDGSFGENVTKNVISIDSIPKKLTKEIDVEVRGEIILPLQEFVKTNNFRKKENLPLFSSPRNAASGSIRQLDSKIVKDRNLKCFFYQVVNSDLDEIETLKFIKSIGLEVPSNYKLCKNLNEIEDFIKYFTEHKKELDYDTDGVVVKVNSTKYKNILGNTSKAPRWAIAYKYPSLQATTKINNVTFQVGRTGVITPVAQLEPVFLSNSLISNATLHNFEDIKAKNIMVGDFVFIERSGEVIPKIIKPIIEKRDGSEIEIEAIKKCPSCNSDLIKENIFIRCINVHCTAKIKKQIEFFASRDCMNIIGLGESIVDKLFSENRIKDIEDVYSLNKESFQNIERFANKAIENLLNSIEESKKSNFKKVLFSLGIENVGEFRANLIVEHFKNIPNIISASLEDITMILGIGKKAAESIYLYFKDPKNIEKINFLKNKGLNFDYSKDKGKLSNKTFCVTGSLVTYSRNQIKSIVEKEGGIFLSSVGKKLDYLIVGDKPSDKLNKAKALNINIINEDKLNELFDIT